MILSEKDIQNISKTIVQLWRYNTCGYLNTYVHLLDQSDVDLPNYGATYETYLEGMFWSRDWVLSGAKRTELKTKQGTLITYKDNGIRISATEQKFCYPYNFVILDEIKCKHCSDTCKRTKYTVDTNIENWANIFINELMRFNYYEYVDVSTNETKTIWATEGMMKYWEGVLLVDSFIEKFTMDMFVDTTNAINIKAVATPFDGCRGCVFSITFCDCKINSTDNFDYSQLGITPSELGVNKCVDC
jgi:hypothetical protein